jgi:hypothetical protein
MTERSRAASVAAFVLLGWLAGLPVSPASAADEPDLIFKRSTVFKWLTRDDKLATYGIDDPEVDGVSCHFTVPEKGGLKGWIGVAEESPTSRSRSLPLAWRRDTREPADLTRGAICCGGAAGTIPRLRRLAGHEQKAAADQSAARGTGENVSNCKPAPATAKRGPPFGRSSSARHRLAENVTSAVGRSRIVGADLRQLTAFARRVSHPPSVNRPGGTVVQALSAAKYSDGAGAGIV